MWRISRASPIHPLRRRYCRPNVAVAAVAPESSFVRLDCRIEEVRQQRQRQQQQQRSFAAWRPEWQQKFRKERRAAAKKKEREMAAVRARIQKMKRRRAKIPLPTMDHIEQPDHIDDDGTMDRPQDGPPPRSARRNAKHKVSMLSILQAFSATSSPFLYLGCDDATAQKINQEPHHFWNHPPAYQRRTSTFEYMPPAAFDYKLPDRNNPLAEVAFLGRSNVGKSSLMNALMQQKLARTSKQPGRTQMVSFYGMKNTEVNPDAMATVATTKKQTRQQQQQRGKWRDCLGFLIDLPGYGFAVGPDEAVDDWQARTQDFLLTRSESGHLRRLYVLVDSRHVNAQSTDFAVLRWLDDNAPHLPYTVVLTKADGVRPQGLVPHLNTVAMRYQQAEFQTQTEVEVPEEQRRAVPGQFQRLGQRMTNMSPLIHITSAQKKMGLQELWSSVCYELQQGPYPRDDYDK
mmetsp:Transcript_11734/g.32508  ORF Transcript_11734/g.32508 Transcript_11734/m.32508 type:complete len:459 (-) Transcript_11734:31-1407(-)